ncbi:hypothetical protein B0J14DRAFT_79453 [Halenospora varia]|nr:hypothetical protein B0J14DRAFT_79453 [Halenospora varia]
MQFSIPIVLALPLICNALPWDGPEQTQVPELGYTPIIAGWSPAPTQEPRAFLDMLFRRQTLSSLSSSIESGNVSRATCGFVSGSTSNAVTCVRTDYKCAQDTQYSVFGCCNTGACQLTTSCVPAASLSLCGNDCAADPYVLKCVTASPYCNQYVLTSSGFLNTAFYCSNAPQIDTVVLTATDGGKGVATLVQVTENIPSKASSTTSTSPSTTSVSPTLSSQSTITITPTPTPSPEPKKSTPIGAIVGGTIGGVFAIALLAILVFFLRKRSNNSTNTATAGAGEAQVQMGQTGTGPTAGYYVPPTPQEKQNYVPGGVAEMHSPDQPGASNQNPYSPPLSPAPQYSPGYAPGQQQPIIAEVDGTGRAH